ncbi:Sodium/hydrogen exchanger family-domain-containing protein, partial [Blyttiomyces helicus]
HQLFIKAILMLILILVVMNVDLLFKKMHFHYLSETSVNILLGLLVATGWTAMSYDEENTAIQLSSKFFYMVLLPPIIFEGGFSLQRISFFQNILTITSLAFFGALYSTFLCSVLMYFFSKLIEPWSFIESLVFGSLISSTDPVTVLSLLPANVDRRLYMLIFGESALNDAVSIILYRFFTGLADPHMRLGIWPFIVSVGASAGVFAGSFCVGVLFGLILAKITKHVHLEEGEAGTYEMTMVLVFAYLSYLIADVIGLTGIISIFFCGITMAHYAFNNLSESTQKSMKMTLRMISFMCECFIFLYLGLGLLSFGGQTTYSPAFVFFACISILVSRSHVFLILGIGNMTRAPDDRVPFNQQVLIWFSGLRGAVAFALGVTFLEHPVFSEDIKGVIFGTTVMVVVITVLVLGGLTPYMLKWLGLSPSADQAVEGTAGHPSAADPTATPSSGLVPVVKDGYGKLEDSKDEESQEVAMQREATRKPVFAWLYRLDALYIRPHFTTLTPGELDILAQLVNPEVAEQARVAS